MSRYFDRTKGPICKKVNRAPKSRGFNGSWQGHIDTWKPGICGIYPGNESKWYTQVVLVMYNQDEHKTQSNI